MPTDPLNNYTDRTAPFDFADFDVVNEVNQKGVEVFGDDIGFDFGSAGKDISDFLSSALSQGGDGGSGKPPSKAMDWLHRLIPAAVSSAGNIIQNATGGGGAPPNPAQAAQAAQAQLAAQLAAAQAAQKAAEEAAAKAADKAKWYKQDYGPLPLWGWLTIGGGIVGLTVLVKFLRK